MRISLFSILILLMLLPSCASKRKLKATEETKTEVIQERKEDTKAALRDSSYTDVNSDFTQVQVTEHLDTMGRVLTKTTTTTIRKTKANKKTGADFTSVKEIKEETKAEQKTETKIKQEKTNKEGRIFVEVIIFICLLLVLFVISIRQLVLLQKQK